MLAYIYDPLKLKDCFLVIHYTKTSDTITISDWLHRVKWCTCNKNSYQLVHNMPCAKIESNL